jgi:hypothetical protein
MRYGESIPHLDVKDYIISRLAASTISRNLRVFLFFSFLFYVHSRSATNQRGGAAAAPLTDA